MVSVSFGAVELNAVLVVEVVVTGVRSHDPVALFTSGEDLSRKYASDSLHRLRSVKETLRSFQTGGLRFKKVHSEFDLFTNLGGMHRKWEYTW